MAVSSLQYWQLILLIEYLEGDCFKNMCESDGFEDFNLVISAMEMCSEQLYKICSDTG